MTTSYSCRLRGMAYVWHHGACADTEYRIDIALELDQEPYIGMRVDLPVCENLSVIDRPHHAFTIIIHIDHNLATNKYECCCNADRKEVKRHE